MGLEADLSGLGAFGFFLEEIQPRHGTGRRPDERGQVE